MKWLLPSIDLRPAQQAPGDCIIIWFTAHERWCVSVNWFNLMISCFSIPRHCIFCGPWRRKPQKSAGVLTVSAGAIMIHRQLLNPSLGSNVFVGSIKCFSCRLFLQLFIYVVNCLSLSIVYLCQLFISVNCLSLFDTWLCKEPFGGQSEHRKEVGLDPQDLQKGDRVASGLQEVKKLSLCLRVWRFAMRLWIWLARLCLFS